MIPGSSNPLLAFKSAAAGGQYQISRSLRFNAPDSASLSRTVGTASNTTTWTWAGWVKRSGLSSSGQILFAAGSGVSNNTRLSFGADDRLNVINEVTSVSTTLKETAAVYRDPSAWMHVVCAVNTNDATAGNRVRLYVNGTEITVFNANNTPSSGLQLFVNSANTHYIGQSFNPAYASFYLADIHFIDGQALGPTSFGEYDATTGVWVPKAYTGTYGTNGFRLPFSDNSAATATTLGKDSAGSNNWTPNNLSVTASSGNDSVVDTPTNYGTDTGAGGEVRGNYCTLNPLNTSSGGLLNGCLDVAKAANANSSWYFTGTMPVSSGKWYFEMNATSNAAERYSIGIVSASQASTVFGEVGGNAGLGGLSTAYAYRNDGNKFSGGSNQGSYGTSWTVEVIGVAFDADNWTITFYKNGVSQGTAFTAITSGTYLPGFAISDTDAVVDNFNFSVNFGQCPFAYPAPSGFKALCSANLPTPTILNGATAMDVVTYTGTGATLTPTSSLGFSPDLVWIKGRSGATDNTLYDIVRGAQARLESNTTDAEVTTDGGLTAFNSNGFTLGTLAQVNTNTATYAAWCWDESVADGFDIVTYTGNGANRAIAHSLGVAPQFMIVKQRTTASATNWAVWHSALANTEYLLLNASDPKATGATYWNSTSPSSSVFSLGTALAVNTNNGTYVAYLWAPVSDYSAFGSYTGNGSADGPFVYTGFRPRWVMLKQTTAASSTSWTIFDSYRLGYNNGNASLIAEGTSNETTTEYLDLLSNGFKLRSAASRSNATAGTYIYAAFAENPFSIARAR